MFRWTPEAAVAELESLIAEVPGLRRDRSFTTSHSRWVARTLAVLEQVFGRNSRYYLSFAGLTWRFEGQTIVGGMSDPEGSLDPRKAIERLHREAFHKHLDAAHGFLLAALDDLKRRGLDAVYDGKNTAPESSALLKIMALAERKLRKTLRERPGSERQIQDAFETLLVGADVSYTRETDAIPYSSKTYTPDFSFRAIGLALELKLCNRAEREKEIIAEINDDIVAYKTAYGNLVFVVYDLGFIRDVDRFADSFEGSEGVVVRVVKH